MIGVATFFGLGFGAIYTVVAVSAAGIAELSLIGSRFNKPWIVITLGALWPISMPGLIVRDLIRGPVK